MLLGQVASALSPRPISPPAAALPPPLRPPCRLSVTSASSRIMGNDFCLSSEPCPWPCLVLHAPMHLIPPHCTLKWSSWSLPLQFISRRLCSATPGKTSTVPAPDPVHQPRALTAFDLQTPRGLLCWHYPLSFPSQVILPACLFWVSVLLGGF